MSATIQVPGLMGPSSPIGSPIGSACRPAPQAAGLRNEAAFERAGARGDAMRHARLAPLQGVGSGAELLQLLGEPPAAAAAALPAIEVSLWRVRQGTVLLHEGVQGHTLYVVRSGSLKCVQTLEDGYEQVLSFAQPGELLGCEALHGAPHPSNVVALECATVYALQVADLSHQPMQLQDALRRGLSRQLARTADTAALMAAVNSEVRLARFILWLSERMREAGQSPRRLRLRMGRRDVASLLGVAHETVSRSFTTLAALQYITVDNREIEILDFDGLKARARCTRGQPADLASSAQRCAREVLQRASQRGARTGAAAAPH